MLCNLDPFVIFFPILIIVIFKWIKYDPPPILNIYNRPNGLYWIKVLFMYILLTLRKLKSKKNLDKTLEKLDTCQKLIDNDKANDSIYFNSKSRNGDCLIVGVSRRSNRLIDGFFYFKLIDSNLGLLESPKLPDSTLYQDEETQEYKVDGIEITSEIPLKKWRIRYDGKMKRAANRDELVDVQIDINFTSDYSCFYCDTDMDSWTLAKNVALTKWDKTFFRKRVAQTHYEQAGILNGTATLNGKKYEINMESIRDHTFGWRDWRFFHRYALHFIALENGEQIMASQVSMPLTSSRVDMGYVYSKNDEKIHPLLESDFQLYAHGENGKHPIDYAFTFRTAKQEYVVEVNVQEYAHLYISKDWEKKVTEGLCTFTVNGLKGWGCVEWCDTNVLGHNAL